MKLTVHNLRKKLRVPLIIVSVIGLLIIGLYSYLVSSLQAKSEIYPELEEAVLISHAGGGLNVGNYSNSKEAIDQAVANGYQYIEVDISQTQNGDWVLIHDWGKSYLRYFIHLHQFPQFLFSHQKSIPKSAQAFQTRKMRYGLTPMTLESLIAWLKDHPEIKIVTDIRGSNYQCLEKIKSMMDGRTDQIIPQIYAPKEHQAIKALGYDKIILTVYNLDLSIDALTELADFTMTHDLFAMTVPQRWINQDIDAWRPDAATHLFTHTINNAAKAEHFKTLGVSGFYTDYMIPSQAVTPAPRNE